MYRPRPAQARVLAWRGGKLGVSAVPGSGKTATLAVLAARLVQRIDLAAGQEVLVVTLVNSVVHNFSARLAQELQRERAALPGLVGYRVRTLHRLANDIVRERPGLAGLAEDFRVIDERESGEILQEAVDGWLRGNPEVAQGWLEESLRRRNDVRQRHWPALLRDVAGRHIRQAKDEQCGVEELNLRLAGQAAALPLAEICQTIFERYESGLRYRGGIDFTDLIRLALRVLRDDRDYLLRLRRRWPWILEDEAQDSSRLQEEILRLLAGPRGNWARVGDPNQAINESFTTASPHYLRDFLQEDDVQAHDMPNSGRNAPAIIGLANRLIAWAQEHPQPDVRALQPLAPPWIAPAPPGDAQPNPPDVAGSPYLQSVTLTSDEERERVARSLAQWLPSNPQRTVAVLLPTNASGAALVQALRAARIPDRYIVEKLNSTDGTRAVAGSLNRVLEYLANPRRSDLMAQAYRVWRRDERGDEAAERGIQRLVTELGRMQRPEDYLWPQLDDDWLDNFAGADEALRLHLRDFRRVVRRWQEAADLPVDQLLLSVGAELFRAEAEIATVWSLALELRQYAERNPDARLPEYSAELRLIAAGRRRFFGMSEDDTDFDPERYRGQVVVTTLHKAKGLEWDRVYLLSVNSYDFPSAQEGDSFYGERWFLRDRLNLEAEALAQLAALTQGQAYREGQATRDARALVAAERLRLLYVGITRARSELIITWNTGRNGDQREALALGQLRETPAREGAQ